MSRKNKIWSILVHLSMNMWDTDYKTLPFDDEMWTWIIEESARIGLNTIILDVGDGIRYPSRPEIAMPGAWDAERIHAEIARCKEKGIALIPKLNFSAAHDQWLGDYARMISSKAYYALAKDLINDAYELFEHPEFIHLGMDEEGIQYVGERDYVCMRQGELYWHDLKFLLDCVNATGARPWIWSSPLYDYPEQYKAHIGPKEAIINPYYYNAFREDHYTSVDATPATRVYYNEGIYKDRGFKWVEQDPYLENFRNVALPLLKEGYDYIPCASVFNRCDWNHADLLEYFRDKAPDDQILGYLTAPWVVTLPNEKAKLYYEETFRFMKEAMDEFYPE